MMQFFGCNGKTIAWVHIISLIQFWTDARREIMSIFLIRQNNPAFVCSVCFITKIYDLLKRREKEKIASTA